MKRCAIVVTVLLTGVLLARAARQDDAPPHSPSPELTAADAADPIPGPAGWRFRHGQPTHWRDCLLRQ